MMWRVGIIVILNLALTAITGMTATFEFFHDPLPSSWASFAFDADGDKLACNYGGNIFLWSPVDGFKDLGEGHPQSGSIGLSADGETICATRVEPSGGYLNPALWSEKTGWVDLGHTLDGCIENESWGSGFDLTDDGTEAVGLAWTCQGAEAFHWSVDQGMIGLSLLPKERTSRATAIAGNGSLLAGFAEHSASGYRQPVCWNPDSDYQQILYAGMEARGEALAINTAGTMVVGYHVVDQLEQAHFWTPVDGLVDLGNLSHSPWDASRATHVSDDGTVCGTSTHNSWNITEAFIWDSFDGMVRLQDYLTDQGADISEDIWLDEVLAVSGDAEQILGSWQNAQGDMGYWLAGAQKRQKAIITECLASIDGYSLKLNFDLKINELSKMPVLVANRGDQKWEVPLHFENFRCSGTDHLANLGQSGEVVYELILESSDGFELLERFSLWSEYSPFGTGALTGALIPHSSENYALNFRLQRPGRLEITNRDDTGRIMETLSSRVFEKGFHQVSLQGMTDHSTGRKPGQFIHFQWK